MTAMNQVYQTICHGGPALAKQTFPQSAFLHFALICDLLHMLLTVLQIEWIWSANRLQSHWEPKEVADQAGIKAKLNR